MVEMKCIDLFLESCGAVLKQSADMRFCKNVDKGILSGCLAVYSRRA